MEDKNVRYLTSCGQDVVELLYAGKPQSCVPIFYFLPGSAVSIPAHRHTSVYAFFHQNLGDLVLMSMKNRLRRESAIHFLGI